MDSRQVNFEMPIGHLEGDSEHPDTWRWSSGQKVISLLKARRLAEHFRGVCVITGPNLRIQHLEVGEM